MSKNWYPVINHENCIECGVGLEHCTHGVYNKEKAPRPVNVNPANCLKGCCESRCGYNE